jgi:hypothetical protein
MIYYDILFNDEKRPLSIQLQKNSIKINITNSKVWYCDKKTSLRKKNKKKTLKSETFQVRILLVPFEGSKYEYICKYFLNLELFSAFH